MRAPSWLRSRRALAAERDSALASAAGWRREVEREAGRTRDAQARAARWAVEVAELLGLSWRGLLPDDGVLLARLRQVVDDGNRAQEVADRARDDEEAAYEAIRRVANALRPGSSGVRVDDVVEWAREASDADSLLASREKLLAQAEQFEAELTAVDEALAKAGATPADDRVEAIRALLGEAVLLRAEQAEGQADALVYRAEQAEAARDRALLAVEEVGGELDTIRAIRAELRATGHPVGDPRGLSYDVDAAIDRERSRAQDLVERLADVLGWPEHRAIWPMSAPHIIRELAVRLGKPMPRRLVRSSDWGPGSRTARALRCTCRGERGHGPTSIVDPRCPEHSPGYRFGGRPARPLALPLAWNDADMGDLLGRLRRSVEAAGEPAPPSRHGLDALDVWDGSVAPGGWVCDVCRFPVESEPCREHQPKAYADMLAEVPF